MKQVLLGAFVLVLLSNCRPAKMALDSEGWNTKEEYKVAGKRGLFTRERMSFGEFYTTEVKRSWVKGSGSRFGLGTGIATDFDYTNIISVEYIKRNQTIRFSLTDGTSRASEVYCVSKFNSTDLTIGNNPNSIRNIAIDIIEAANNSAESKYYVQLYLGKGERPWELLLDNVQAQMKPGSYVGYLSQSPDNYYTIVPVRKMEGKDGKPAPILFGAVGFEFRDKNNRPLAAVSLIDRGVVYFGEISNNEKFLLANACAALLMQEEIG